MMYHPPFLQLFSLILIAPAFAAFNQGQEADYLTNFDSINTATYSVVKDSPNSLPSNLLSTCGNIGSLTTPSSGEVTVQVAVDDGSTSIVNSTTVSSQCNDTTVCIIPFGMTFQVDASINLGALIVRGNVEWTDDTMMMDVVADDDSSGGIFVCAGYIVVEGLGKWEMNVQGSKGNKNPVIYIKDNGFEHAHLRSRAFGR